jgi:hypothetical protein
MGAEDFDTRRVQRIIGEDGRPELVTLNEKKMEGAVERVLNDMTVGTYDVVMQTGPGYNSRRQESVQTLMQILDTPLGEKIAAVADDIIVRQMDFNGADVVADRWPPPTRSRRSTRRATSRRRRR